MIGLLAILYLLASTATADAVPVIAAALAAVLPATGATIGATAVTYATVLATAIVTAASVGLSLLMAPKADGGSKGQVTVRQARPPRLRVVATEKLGGAQAFLEADNRFLNRMIVHCEGPVESIEEIWLNDKLIVTTGTTVKINSTRPWVGDVVIETKLGTTTQTASTILLGTYDQYSDFSDRWTADHQLKGLCYSIIRARATKDAELFGRRFPNGIPDLRVVARAGVYDPRTEATAYSTNAALWIYDYLINPRGLAIPEARVDLDSFSAFADICDDAISLKGGGTEPRYQIIGSYDLTEEPREVLRRFLQTCDAELYMTPEGKVAIRGGVWNEPTVTITEANIIALTYEQGNDRLAAFNRIILSYKSREHGWEVIETQEWDDDEAQSLSGEVKTQELSLVMVPSHGQARRLAKIMMAKGNPRHKLTIQTDMAGLDVLGERIIRVVLPELNIDETFHVQRFEILSDLKTCSIDLVSLEASAYAWNAATEEGDAPPVPQTTSNPYEGVPPPVPTGLALELVRTEIAPVVFVLRISASVDAPSDDRVSTFFEYRIVSSGDDWAPMETGESGLDGLSEILIDGDDYEVRASHTIGSEISDPTTPETISAVADVDAPDSVSELTVTPSVSQATIEWLNPNSENYHATRIYRGTTSTFSAATLVAVRYGAANAPDIYVDNPLAGGPYYWWAVAANASGVEAVEIGVDDIVELWFDFTGGTLDPGIAFTRASSGTRINSSGVLVTETTNVARLDYDPVTLAALGILIEPARTNLALRSAEFDNAYWSKSSATVTSNSINSPAGTLTADTITDTSDGAPAVHSVNNLGISLVSGLPYTLSVYVKAGTLSGIALLAPSSAFGSNISARFNLATGSVASSDAGITARISALANGWFRCSITATATATASTIFQIRTANLTTSFYQGNGLGTLYLWGAQVEQASAASSFIETTTATVTRAADVAKFTPALPVDEVRFSFDDNSTSDASVTAGVEYTVPTSLSRPRIKNIRSLVP